MHPPTPDEASRMRELGSVWIPEWEWDDLVFALGADKRASGALCSRATFRPALVDVQFASADLEARWPATARQAATAAAESRAAKKLIELFERDPECRLSRTQFRSELELSEPLGPRGFERVWRRATKQAPHRSRPGRKKSNHHAD